MLDMPQKTIGRGGFEVVGLSTSNSSQARGFPSSQGYGANWSKQRQRCLERDGYQCQICGTDPLDIGRELSVHHITPRSEFEHNDRHKIDSIDNLITLCPSCHDQFEGEFTDSTPVEFIQKAKETLSA